MLQNQGVGVRLCKDFTPLLKELAIFLNLTKENMLDI